jgi:E3 ubiquitin-protein ligase HUWE1
MYQPSPKSYVNPNHLQFFKFIGRVVGKALHDGYLLDAYFTPAFYKHILGKPLSWTDMQE